MIPSRTRVLENSHGALRRKIEETGCLVRNQPRGNEKVGYGLINRGPHQETQA
jgi:hypothetical protein